MTNSLVVDLDATDRDDGLNQELVYYFVGGSQDFESFHIDRSDGTLHIARDLDYETTQEYTVSVLGTCSCDSSLSIPQSLPPVDYSGVRPESGNR